MSVKTLFTVKSIDTTQTKEWLVFKHYAKRMCSISYSFGLFDERGLLVGVCTFGSPPSRSLCVGICGVDNAHRVNELNRLCTNEDLGKNALSYFVSQCLGLLPSGLIIVSYADTSMGHHGYIYQATNWIYTGLSAKRTERYDPDNPNKHSKTVTESKTLAYESLPSRNRPQKHRYVCFTGTKRDKRSLKGALRYSVENYPKGDNRRYDSGYEPSVQTTLF